MKLKNLKKGEYFVFPATNNMDYIEIWKKGSYERNTKSYRILNIFNKEERLVNSDKWVFKILLK